jgi:UDP-2,3-diacylglucosamine hydrolase
MTGQDAHPAVPTAARHLLIADCHLRAGEHARTRRLLDWLDAQAGRCASLTILGDLFDFWIGPKHLLLPDYHDALDVLGRWAASGVTVELFAGNRDFYLGDVLTERFGIRVFHDFAVRPLGARRAYLAHGDLLCGADRKYRRARHVVRSRLVERLFTALPANLACFLADGYRNHSRRVVAAKSDRELALCPQTLERVFRGHGDLNLGRSAISTGEVDVIICGHTHHCGRLELELDGRRCVVYALGSWIEGGSFLEVAGDRFTLHASLD